jgi:hypothetical protein
MDLQIAGCHCGEDCLRDKYIKSSIGDSTVLIVCQKAEQLCRAKEIIFVSFNRKCEEQLSNV